MTDPLRILCIMAHPDDIDFSAAATVDRWVRAGAQITYLIVTSGDAGGYDDAPRSEMIDTRRAEQINAAAVVGVSDVRFLHGYSDGFVEPTHDLMQDLVRVMRQVRPHRVVTHSAERSYDYIWQSHPDHLAVGEAVIRAMYPAAENPFSYPQLLHDENLAAWRIPELWLVGHPTPDHAELIDEGGLATKLDALRAHTSQMPDLSNLEALIRNRLLTGPRPSGIDPAAMVEAFRVPHLHDPEQLAHSAASDQ